ncbi:MAG: serine hydrolase [Planctomycetota bacterium]
MNTLLVRSLMVATSLTIMGTAGQADELQDRLIPLAKPMVDGGRAMGLSVGVIADGEVTTFHLGQTAKGKSVANDDTVYEIGSISKVFTSVLLADAVERQQLKLTQNAEELLPQGSSMPEYGGTPITLLHLATHRSGLPRLPSNLTEVQDDNPYSRYTSKRAMEFLRTHQLARKPGQKYEYSNFGTSLLGYLVSKSSGKDYEALLRQTVTEPLGMQSTSVELTASMKQRLATPHDGSLTPTSTWEFADLPGAGGIRSTLSDMMKFAQANLEPGDDGLGKAMELAWRQHQGTGSGGPAMGLGWHVAGDGSTRWHNGGTGGYRCMMMVNRKLQSAVVVLCNTAAEGIDPLAAKMLRSLAGEDVKPDVPTKEVQVPVAKMKRLEGRYQLAPSFIFDVKVKGDKLMVVVTNQPTLQVFPKSETVWFYKVVEAEVTFNLDKNGRPRSLVLFQNGVRQTAKRIR